jgi:hypothetical protein
MSINEFGVYHELDDDALLALYDRQRQRVKESQDVLGHLEQEIFRRTEERKATGIPSDRYECTVKVANAYDQTRLTPLREVLSPDELDRCCIPEHQETVTVPEKWNVTKLWPIARKRGADVANAIEKARIPGRRTLDFKRKET